MLVEADLHIHSTCSDGEPNPAEIVDYARSIGLKVISITDHDTFKGSKLAYRYVRSRGYSDIVLIFGCEVRTYSGDVLVLCPNPLDNYPKSLHELVDYARDSNCIVIPAHPFDTFRKGCGYDIDSVQDKVRVIECFNASSPWSCNMKALEYARSRGFKCAAFSDAHILDYIGVYKTMVEVENLTIDDVLYSIEHRKLKPIIGRVTLDMLLKRISWSVRRRFK